MSSELVEQLRQLAHHHPDIAATLNTAANTLQTTQQQADTAHNILANPSMVWLITQPHQHPTIHAEQLKPQLVDYWETYGPQFIDFTDTQPPPNTLDDKATVYHNPIDPNTLELTTGEHTLEPYRPTRYPWHPIRQTLQTQLKPYTPTTITQHLNISHQTLKRWQKHGLTHTETQQTAQTLGTTPTTLWPNWTPNPQPPTNPHHHPQST